MKIYFQHIGKTAGTTVRNFLVERLGVENVSPMLRGVKLQDALRDYADCAAIAGHITAIPGDAPPGDRLAFTLLRDPLDRALSAFFFRKTSHLAGRARSERPFESLEAWLDQLDEMGRMALNAHTEALWAFGWSKDSLPTPRERTEAAGLALERFDLIGVQSDLEHSLSLLAHAAGIAPPGLLARANATAGRPPDVEVSDQAIGRLRRYLESDFEVYHRALVLYGRQQGPSTAAARSRVPAAPLAAGSAGAAPDRHDLTAHPSAIGASAHSSPELRREPGDRPLAIESVVVRGLHSGTAAVQTGESVSIEIRFRAGVAEPHLTVGVAIRDHHGALVFGTNTRLLGDNLAVAPGTYCVKFSFRNDLGLGRYRVVAALHRGASELEGSFDHLDNAAQFEVIDTIAGHFEGLVRLHVDVVAEATSGGASVVASPDAARSANGAWTLGRRNPVLGAFAARITPTRDDIAFHRAADLLVELDIANLSTETWNAYGRRPVRVSYHWIDEHGGTVEFDGLRTSLPRDIQPGESLRMACFVRAPEKRGRMKLVWTLVQEEVAWFDTMDPSSRCEVDVNVM